MNINNIMHVNHHHPKMSLYYYKINNIYNSHYTGSQLWLLGSKEMDRMEATYNKSIKVMFNLPWGTHRKLLEPLTGAAHLRRILVQRYLSFIRKIQNSNKKSLRSLLSLVKNDVRTTTGSNLRTIMQWTGSNSIDDILNQKVDIEYHIMEEQEAWKAEMIKEVIDAKEGYADLGLDYEQMAQILEYLCTG